MNKWVVRIWESCLLPCSSDKEELRDFIGLGETHQRSLEFPSLPSPVTSPTLQVGVVKLYTRAPPPHTEKLPILTKQVQYDEAQSQSAGSKNKNKIQDIKEQLKAVWSLIKKL